MIEVITTTGIIHHYPDDSIWKIDEERQLHLYKPRTAGDDLTCNRGGYGTNTWISVRRDVAV